MNRLLEAGREQWSLPVGGVTFDQQQLEDGFPGRIDSFVELPDASARQFCGRNIRHRAKVDVIAGLDKPTLHQLSPAVVVIGLPVYRDQPPQRILAGEVNAGAIELIQQQKMLGAAAVFPGDFHALAPGPPIGGREHKHMQFHPQATGPFRQFFSFALQAPNARRRQILTVAEPDIQITGHRVPERARASHQEQTVQIRLSGTFVTVVKTTGVTAGRIQHFRAGRVTTEALRAVAIQIARQGRMVTVKNQRQQLQHHLLPVGQCRARPPPALLVNQQKPVPQAPERLAVDSILEIENYGRGVNGQESSGKRLFSAR